MISSLRTRVLLAVGAVAIAAIAAVALVTRQGTRQAFFRLQEVERLTTDERIADTQSAIARLLDGRCCRSQTISAGPLLKADDAVLVMDDAHHSLVYASGEPVLSARSLRARLAAGVLTVELTRGGATAETVELRFRKAASPIRLADGRAALLFVVPIPRIDGTGPSGAFLGSVDRRILLAVAIVGVLALAGTWLVAQNTVRPIRRLQEATALVARGSLRDPVPTDGPREIAELAGSFNRMATELDQQRILRRNLMHDVTHELRAPLTALRCRLESVLDGIAPDPAQSIRDLHEQVLHLSQLVDDLQEIALAEAHELRLQLTHAPLAEVVRSALKGTGLESDPRIGVDLAAGVAARADQLRLRQVLINLLTNADRHTPPDETIVIRGRLDGGMAVVEVENGGSSLDGDQCQRIFDRFYRTDPSRQRNSGGIGLGLAIVRHLVEAQDGRVWARSDGGRVTIGLALPASAATAPER